MQRDAAERQLTAAAERRDQRALGRAAPCRRAASCSGCHAPRACRRRRARISMATMPCPGAGTHDVEGQRRRDAVANAEPAQARRGQHERIVLAVVELAQARIDVAADRRRSVAPGSTGSELRATPHAAGADRWRLARACASAASRSRGRRGRPAARARRADPRAAAPPRSEPVRQDPPACPWRCGPRGRRRRASSASSISLTNRRLPPGLATAARVCSRSPVVLMMTISTRVPARRQRRRRSRACHSASGLPRVPSPQRRGSLTAGRPSARASAIGRRIAPVPRRRG